MEIATRIGVDIGRIVVPAETTATRFGRLNAAGQKPIQHAVAVWARMSATSALSRLRLLRTAPLVRAAAASQCETRQ